MQVSRPIFPLPRALAENMESGRPEYELALRKVRWGDGPMYITGHGDSFFAALTGARDFESLLGLPVLAQTALDFCNYSAAAIQPHSVFLAISQSGETVETLDAMRAARSRGAQVLAMTGNSSSAMATAADQVFLTRTGNLEGSGEGADLIHHTAIGYLALLASRLLKRHHRQLDALEIEFQRLPATVETIAIQLGDAIRALARELQRAGEVAILGAGCYWPVALQSASLLHRIRFRQAVSVNAAQGVQIGCGGDGRSMLFLSGTGCRLKKTVHAMAADAQGRGSPVLAMTDGNDRELLKASSLAIILPGATEMTGALLALAGMEFLSAALRRDNAAYQKGRAVAPPMAGVAPAHQK